jgi:hypothetical protein
MFKRILMVFILAVGVLALRSGEVDAHLAGYTYSPTYRHIASYDCTGTFAQVPSLTQHPALFKCNALVLEFEVACANPQGKITLGNSGPRLIPQTAEGLISEADLTDKIKGKAKKTLLLEDNLLEEGDAICKARNRNWRAVDELVTSVDVILKSFDCVGDPTLDPFCEQREQAFEALLHCSTPICPNGQPCSVVKNPPPGNNTPTDYPCTVLAEAHCDEGELCPIELP